MRGEDPRIIGRPERFEDWQALLDLILRSFAYMDGVIDPPSSANRLTPQALEARARQETLLLAYQGEQLAGCLFLADRGDHVYLGKLAIEPALQGLGLGRRFVEAAERLARSAGKKALELETRIELHGNHAVFARLGFTEVARTAHPGFERPTSITMRKVLA
ncbi:MAG TPA: GNAT family N-acetyltransferase [Rhizobiaceae bacterium]|nr:GNAT family N-acetyltransferase [Rhizobiaceae bacterium]